jgi:hypothetical protein
MLVHSDRALHRSLFGRYVDLAVANQLGEQLHQFPPAVPAVDDLSTLFNIELFKAMASTAGDSDRAAAGLLRFLPRRITPRSLARSANIGIEAAALLRASTMRPIAGMIAVTVSAAIYRAESQDMTEREISRLDPLRVTNRQLSVLSYRSYIQMLTPEWFGGEVKGLSPIELAAHMPTGAVETMVGYFVNPLVHAEFSMATARMIEHSTGYPTDESLIQWIQVLATLNTTRHKLTNPTDRKHWWATFNEVLEIALDRAATRRDWRALAELVEVARFQLQDSEERAAFRETVTALSVRGRSLFGASHYAVGAHPSIEDFEDIVSRAVGHDGYWWSTWLAGGRLYWALVPQNIAEPVRGGVLPRDKWDGPEHRELFGWLPVQQDGEWPPERAARVERGALVGLPNADEYRVARAWGAVLPPTVRASLEHTEPHGTRLRLGMALCPELSQVPWAWTAVDERRLVEVADLVVVPPASLVALDPGGGRLPLAAAVVNPAGNLRGVESLPSLLPGDIDIQVSGETDPQARFRALLAGVPKSSSVLIACHTERIDGRLGLDVGGGSDVRITFDDLARRGSGLEMPEQVLAMACETSDVASAQRGEWTVLGAGFLSAGAKRAVVTAYLHPNVPVIDSRIARALGREPSLVAALGSVQRGLLDEWRAGDQDAAPVRWAGIQIFGSIGSPAQGTGSERWVREDLIGALDSAAEHFGRPDGRIGVDEFLRISTLYLETALTGGPKRHMAVYSRLQLGSYLVRRRFVQPSRFVIDDDLMAVLKDAREISLSNGRLVFGLSPLLAAALRHRTPRARTLLRIIGSHAESPELVNWLLAIETSAPVRVGRTPVPHLAPGEVERVYEVFGVRPPARPAR